MSHFKGKDQSSDPVIISRRSLLVLSFSSFLALLFKPFKVLFASDRSRTLSGLPAGIKKGDLAFFNPEQAALVDEISSHIIPSDKDPGAREAGIVYEIDGMVTASSKHQGLYTRGLAVLDNTAAEIFSKKGFMSLSKDEQITLLKAVETGNVAGLAGEKIAIDSRAVRTAILFFALIKKQTFEAFYSGNIGWQVAGYKGPPQWKGNRDYNKCS